MEIKVEFLRDGRRMRCSLREIESKDGGRLVGRETNRLREMFGKIEI